jgi:uncharacterized protein YbjT (DUF2867 family)
LLEARQPVREVVRGDLGQPETLAQAVDGVERVFAGKTYPLTGPEALSVSEQVEILASVLGKRIEYVPISDEASREAHLKAGLPARIVDALLPFAAYVRSGKAAHTLPTVEQVTGRAAYTFAPWARDHRSAFA